MLNPGLSQLKIDEIISEISLSNDETKNVKRLFEVLSADLKSMDTKKGTIDLEKCPTRIETVSIPFLMDPSAVKGQLSLTPPKMVKLCSAFQVW